MQIFRERRVKLRAARKDFGIKRRECDVVERQAEVAVRRKKLIRRLVERIVEAGIARRCHVRKCLRSGSFGKQILYRSTNLKSEVQPLFRSAFDGKTL